MDPILKRAIDHGLEAAIDRYYSNYRSTVTNNKDPLGLGRVRTVTPGVTGQDESAIWCRPNFMQVGPGYGWFWPPYEGDQTNVWYENGDGRFPNYEGSWSRDGEVPVALAPTKGTSPVRRGFTLKNGMMLIFDETSGGEGIVLVWSNGTTSSAKKSVLSFDQDGSFSVTTASGRRITLDEKNGQLFFADLDASGNVVNTLTATLDDGWAISAASNGSVQAMVTIGSNGDVQLIAQGQATVTAPSVSLESKSVAVGGASAIHQMVKGDILVQLLTQLCSALSALTVQTGTGVSSPPVNVAQFTDIASQLQTMLTLGHKISD